MDWGKRGEDEEIAVGESDSGEGGEEEW